MIVTVVLAFVFAGLLKVTEPRLVALSALADGDLAFQTDKTKQMVAILLATGSVYKLLLREWWGSRSEPHPTGLKVNRNVAAFGLISGLLRFARNDG